MESSVKSDWWDEHIDKDLRQGDYLPDIPVPIYNHDLVIASVKDGKPAEIDVYEYNLIVLTNSCDLVQSKTDWITLCPVQSKAKFLEDNPHMGTKNKWPNIESGKVKDLHLLECPWAAEEIEEAFVVQLRHIYTLPLLYIVKQVNGLDRRWRLKSPNLEKLSAKFGSLFSDVATPDPSWRMLKSKSSKSEAAQST